MMSQSFDTLIKQAVIRRTLSSKLRLLLQSKTSFKGILVYIKVMYVYINLERTVARLVEAFVFTNLLLRNWGDQKETLSRR